MEYTTILLDKKDRVAKITLNRPEVLNAINTALIKELAQALDDVKNDPDVDVVILTGAGRAFCAGMDLKDTEGGLEKFDTSSYVTDSLRNLEKPTIAAVNGYAITGGMETALTCDIVIASENAAFRDTHVRVGVSPGGGNTQKLPRLIGEKKAKEILFTSDFIPAREAERIGMINKVVPADKLEEEAMLMAKKIVAQPQRMIRKIKRVISQGMGMDLNAAMIFERLECIQSLKELDPEEAAQAGSNVIQQGRAETK